MIEITTPGITFGPLERCLYCRRKSYERTTEHIIPYGIAQNSLVARKASCNRCAKLTREHETFVLRTMWWSFRTKIGMRTRNKAEVPKTFALHRNDMGRISDGQIEPIMTTTESVDVAKFPLFYFAFRFPRCRILTGRPPNEDRADGFFFFDRDSLLDHFDHTQGMRATPGNWAPFTRMLAKIGHSYGISRLGFDAFEPDLALFIQKKQDGQVLQWIGCCPDEPALPTTLHDIALRAPVIDGRRYAVVNLRLFSSIGAPTYEIVLGALNPATPDLDIFREPPHLISIREPIPFNNIQVGKDVSGWTRAQIEEFVGPRPSKT